MGRALVVDDHDAQRFIVCNILQQLGFGEVVSVNNATAALHNIDKSETHPFDIAICDLQMPFMDGIEFVRELQKRKGYIPSLVFMSAFDSKVTRAAEMVAAAYKINVLGSIQKPVSLGVLKGVLERKLNQRPSDVPPDNPLQFSIRQIRAGLKGDQFIPYYQPKINLVSGQCVGVEMLARWNHPVHGVLYPNSFSDIFRDEEGCSVLTKRLIVMGLADLARIKEQNKKISIAINLTWHLMKQPSFTDFLLTQAIKYQINPADVMIEITESEEMNEMNSALDNMVRLRLYGFQLSLDDFGSGYSNMQVISQLPINQLKIDRGLIRHVEKNMHSLKVLESVVELAKSLSLSIVAEGIETEEELKVVKFLGVDIGQGYYFAKPMSAEALYKYI